MILVKPPRPLANSSGIPQGLAKNSTIKYNSNLLDNKTFQKYIETGMIAKNILKTNEKATVVPNLKQARNRHSSESDGAPTDGAMSHDGKKFLKAKEPPLDIRFRYLPSNFLARAASRVDHKVLHVLQEVADLEDTPTLINRDDRVNLVGSFREIDKYRHLIMSSNGPLCYKYGFESIMQ